MAAALEELINNIQEMVQEAWTLPLSSDKCVIERERMLDLIDELRSTPCRPTSRWPPRSCSRRTR